MSLLLLEGFDLYNGLNDAGRVWSSWSGIDSAIVGGRTGRAAWQLGGSSGSNFLHKQFAVGEEHATYIVGFGFNRGNNADVAPISFLSDGGSTFHVSICFDSLGACRVTRGTRTGTTLGTSANGVLMPGGWHYVEAKVTLSDTVGIVVVNIDGIQVLNLTAQDTKNAGTKTGFDSIQFRTDYSLGAAVQFDDIYMLNGAAPTPTDFLGEIRVRTLLPNGNGATSNGVGSDSNSVDNYALVNDTTPTTGTATYVDIATTDQEDTYTFADLTETTGTIAAVQTSTYAQKTDTGVRSLAHVTRIGSTDYVSSDATLAAGSFAWQVSRQTVSPATAIAFTRAEINAAEFGVRAR